MTDSLFPFLLLGLLFLVMYFLVIRPQSRRRKELLELQNTLGPGSDVQTIGGLYGMVVHTDDESLWLEISDGVVVRFLRSSVARVLPESDELVYAYPEDEVAAELDDELDAVDAVDEDTDPADDPAERVAAVDEPRADGGKTLR